MSGTPELLAAVSAETGVPAQFLTGDTAADVGANARTATEWKHAPAVAPVRQTAAVSPTVQPTPLPTPQQLAEANDWLDAWREGRLSPAGVPQPPLRRNTGHNRYNGPS
jgi:hypothetical protein